MRPVDKFGQPIYERPFSIMKNFGRVLESYGYLESRNQPNLFYKKVFYEKKRWALFFADMRGTSEVPIWQEPSPLFYVKFSDVNLLKWQRNRIAQEEFFQLKICRDSYDFDLDSEYDLQGENGYCVVCGENFEDNGSYCSAICEEADQDLYRERCRACGKILDLNQCIEHHLSYKRNKTITVCRSCHQKIHRGKLLKRLKPVDKKVNG